MPTPAWDRVAQGGMRGQFIPAIPRRLYEDHSITKHCSCHPPLLQPAQSSPVQPPYLPFVYTTSPPPTSPLITPNHTTLLPLTARTHAVPLSHRTAVLYNSVRINRIGSDLM